MLDLRVPVSSCLINNTLKFRGGYIQDCDHALKITWIRRLMRGNQDWEEIAVHYKIDRLEYTTETCVI